ncbi:MAG: hypothetical protein ACK4MV_19985 [Beijerinckiaceae bacterium]
MPEHQARMLGMDFLVCPDAGSSPFVDDLKDACADCGRMLSFRPYLAAESPKVCKPCFMRRRDGVARRGVSGGEH